jgi:class 3 adenylate cyclase
VILEEDEDDLTMTERFRMLSNIFNLKPAPNMEHLDSPERRAREQALIGSDEPKSLVKDFDPLTFETLLNPDRYQLQSNCQTVVFWDISGFSDMSLQFVDDPTSVIILLKKYFNEANKIIHRHDGVLDKFIGDGIMTYFGYYDNAGNQATINSINAALELKEKFIVIRDDWVKESALESKNAGINVKCGIHTGNVLFGIIDTEYRNQITAIGNTVNFASRLEGAAKKDEILISAEIKEKVEGIFTIIEEERELQSWGKIKVYIVTGGAK